MSVPILAPGKISKRFGAIVVADAIDLALGEGEALGIIGPNGAGKTSLLRSRYGLALKARRGCDRHHADARKGLWGLVAERLGFSVFPLERRVILDDGTAPRAVKAAPDGR